MINYIKLHIDRLAIYHIKKYQECSVFLTFETLVRLFETFLLDSYVSSIGISIALRLIYLNELIMVRSDI